MSPHFTPTSLIDMTIGALAVPVGRRIEWPAFLTLCFCFAAWLALGWFALKVMT